jgi:hypothetical protein
MKNFFKNSKKTLISILVNLTLLVEPEPSFSSKLLSEEAFLLAVYAFVVLGVSYGSYYYYSQKEIEILSGKLKIYKERLTIYEGPVKKVGL